MPISHTGPRQRRAAATALAFVLAAPALEAAQAAEAERPAIKRLRYDEDWSPLRDDPALRTGALDALKFIPLTPSGDSWLTLGGQARLRWEYFDNPAFGDDPNDANGAFLQRYHLHADAHLGSHVRLFGELSSIHASGREGGDSPVDENELDLHQAFLDLSAGIGDGAGLTLRAGRQELRYGSTRILDYRDGPNLRRRWDGAKVILDAGDWRADLLAFQAVTDERGRFDDGTDASRALWGFYAQAPGDLLPAGNLQLYYLGFDNDRGRYVQGTAGEQRHTLGTRLYGDAGPWDWDLEFAYQFGSFGDGDISAWTAQGNVGHTFADLPLSPRLALSANIASGDKDPGDGDLDTFNPLFPRGSYYDEIGLVRASNIVSVNPYLTFNFSPAMALTTNWHVVWRLEETDGIYHPNGAIVRRPADGAGDFVGSFLSANWEWQVTEYLYTSIVYAHGFAGEFIERTGASRDIDFLELTLHFRF